VVSGGWGKRGFRQRGYPDYVPIPALSNKRTTKACAVHSAGERSEDRGLGGSRAPVKVLPRVRANVVLALHQLLSGKKRNVVSDSKVFGKREPRKKSALTGPGGWTGRKGGGGGGVGGGGGGGGLVGGGGGGGGPETG